VIEVAQRGLKVLEASWDPVTLDMQIMPLSASVAALRTQRGEEEQGVDIRYVMGDVVVHLTLIPAVHDRVQLYLRAQKQGVPLSQVRVTVRREGRTVYARKLSVTGEMQVPQLTPGEYIMSLPQEGVEMTVVLQTAPAT